MSTYTIKYKYWVQICGQQKKQMYRECILAVYIVKFAAMSNSFKIDVGGGGGEGLMEINTPTLNVMWLCI